MFYIGDLTITSKVVYTAFSIFIYTKNIEYKEVAISQIFPLLFVMQK
jgi:hypothetical protein